MMKDRLNICKCICHNSAVDVLQEPTELRVYITTKILKKLKVKSSPSE